MEQEDLDEKMLKTGTVPVLPNGPVGEGEFIIPSLSSSPIFNSSFSPHFYPP